MSIITLCTPSDIQDALQCIEDSAVRAQKALSALPSAPMHALHAMKFDPVGSHPLEDRPLNIIEQVNQTFTYLVAVKAAEILMDWHPDAKGFRLAPGAHAPKGTLDVESLEPGLVGAETFAAVRPENNQKLAKDLKKLSNRSEIHRYIFFMSPAFAKSERIPSKERDGVKVFSISMNA